MSKKYKAIIIIIEFILLILTIVSLNDSFQPFMKMNLTPVFVILMFLGIIIAALYSKMNKK